MTDSSQPPGDTKKAGSGAPSAPARRAPVQTPMNLVTPVTIHETWEDSYRKEESRDSGDVDYKEFTDGSIVISKQSLELIKRKLDAAKSLKNRHLKILKIHEQLMQEHENLLHERERASRARELAPEPQPKGAPEDMVKALARLEKVAQALSRCRWYEFMRRKTLLRAMKRTLAYMKRRTVAP